MTGDAPRAPWRIGVDVGGTFTDMVLADADGRLHVAKSPSVPADPAAGVIGVLERAAGAAGLAVEDLLAHCTHFVHGSTIATNTVLEGKGARVGLLVTAGFRDTLEIRRGLRINPWDHRTPFPPVLVPRYLRRPVGGRLAADGREIAPLAEDDLHAAARAFAEDGVEAVAICFLHSFRNGVHERRAAELMAALLPEAWLSVSSQVVPIIGEYERCSTTVMNAYVGPRVVGYLRALDDRLRSRGLARPMFLLQSNGGAISVDQVARSPVNLVLSGPAAAVGALAYLARSAASDDLIAMEIGGTSCDVTLMHGGRVAVTEELDVDGYHVAIPSVDIHTVGAGGGTIAGVDGAGLLFAGPRGAGARPGPAAYGLGGSEPTVTDAHLVLGRLRPGPYAGGTVSLDAGLARAALRERVAVPLGIEEEAAATGVIRLVEQNLLHAVERISIQRGHDPRRFVLVACGGAGPMHGVAVARRLGVRRVLVPRLSGAFCALGMLNGDVRHDLTRVHLAVLAAEAMTAMEAGYAVLEAEGRDLLAEAGFAPDDIRTERWIDLRYGGQQWDVRVPLDAGTRPEDARAAFEAEYDRLYGHIQPGGAIETTRLRVIARGRLPALAAIEAATIEAAPAPAEHRRVYVDDRAGWRDVAVHAGAALGPGHRLAGPLLIAEETTTILVGAGDTVTVDAVGNYVIDLAATEAAS